MRPTLRILKVVEPFPIGVEPWVGQSKGLDQIDVELKRHASHLIKKITERLKKQDLRVQSAIRHDGAASEIVKEAKRWAADLIVVGRTDITPSSASFSAEYPCRGSVILRVQLKW